MAKLNGIYVKEFSLGMGPQLLQWGKKETIYSIRLFPIGGYVSMDGEDEDSDDPRAFCNKSVLQRMSVVFAGPFMNFICAILFFIVVFMYFGTPANDSVIGEVAADSPAYEAGIEVGDEILTIDGVEVSNWEDMTSAIRPNNGEAMVFEIDRNGEVFETTVVPQYNEELGYSMVGITQNIEKANLIQSVKLGFVRTYEFTVLLVQTLWQMITGQAPVDVAGPVGMVTIVDEYASAAIMNLFMLAGILSINLGVINLIPFPAMDGFRLVSLAIEGVRGKPIPAEKEGMINFVGIIVLLGLMVLITMNDIGRIVGM